MFQHILIPLDGSALAETVLPHLFAIYKVDQPKISLLRVLDPSNISPELKPVDPFDWQLRKAEAESYLNEISRRLTTKGLRVEVFLLEGRAAEMIIDFAYENQVDLIMVSSHGASGISGWNVSGVVQKVILRARTSVLIVRAYHPPEEINGELTYKKILLPLDGSARAEVVLPVVSALAQTYDCELIAVHIVNKPIMPRRTPPSEEDLILAETLTERNRLEASNYLNDLQSRMGSKVTTRLYVENNLVSALHKVVEQEGADIVVLSAHGYSGETKWPYGSVVISFISYGTTPLLIIQDLPPDRMELSEAELAALEQGSR